MSVKFDGSAGTKSFHSSSVEPTSSGTPAAEPRASDSIESRGCTSPSIDRLQRHAADLGVGVRARRRRERGLRLQGSARCVAARAARRRLARAPSFAAKCSAIFTVRSSVFAVLQAPLCGIAFWNSPRALGRPSSVPTLMPPADSPKMVTFSGSPPKAAMFSRTHSSAATWSSMPSLPVDGMRPPVSSRRRRKPSAPSR